MKKRIMGIETEYGSILRLKNGKFSGKDSAGYFFRELKRELNKTLKHLKICPGSSESVDFWIGRTGGKFYEDREHIEYSSPECSGAKEVSLLSSAGDMMLAEIVSILKNIRMAGLKNSQFSDFLLTKNNSDFVRPVAHDAPNVHGDSPVNFYGSHENYLINSALYCGSWPGDDSFEKKFVPFLVSRPILHGSGGFWWTHEKNWHYVLSPRSYVIEKLRGIDSMAYRPIIQVRKSYGYDHMERLHLIYADSNMSDRSTFLKFGATHLVLRALEEIKTKAAWPELDNAVWALQDFSSDPSLRKRTVVCGRKSYNAMELQKFYLDLIGRLRLSEEEKEIARYWSDILQRLEKGWESVDKELDWAIKLSFLKSLMKKNSYCFQDERARVADVLYSDISEKGIFNRLKKLGAINPLFGEEEVRRACLYPPRETRACLRSKYMLALLELVPEKHEAIDSLFVSWDSLHLGPSFKIPDPFKFQSRELDKFLEKISKY